MSEDRTRHCIECVRLATERDEAIKQSRHAWHRHAEKDRAYDAALDAWRALVRAEAERLTFERDAARARTDTASLARAEAAERDRDAARAEVERLRARVRSVDRSTDYNGNAFSDGESSQEDLAIVASERERLRRERDYALAEISRRDREHDALVEMAQKALANVAAERDAARAEIERLRGERDEALVESARRALSLVAIERDEACSELAKLVVRADNAASLIGKNGCDCECDHDAESHDETCERCLACRISEALWPSVSK